MLPSAPTETKREPWQLYAVLLGALAAIFGGVVAAKDVIPQALLSFLVGAIGFGVVLVVGYGMVGQRVAFKAKNSMERRKENQRSRQCLGDFRDLVDEFWSLSYGGTLDAIQKLPKMPNFELWKKLCSERGGQVYQQSLQNLRNQLETLSVSDLGLWGLTQAVARFETTIMSFWSVFAWGYVQAVIMLTDEGGVPPASKKLYDQFREKYNRFVERYNAFGKKWNRKIKKTIFNAYLPEAELLQEVEKIRG